MDSKQGPQAVTGHLDMFKMGLDRKTPTSAEIEAELYEVLCNFKDYKIDRESVRWIFIRLISSLLFYKIKLENGHYLCQ